MRLQLRIDRGLVHAPALRATAPHPAIRLPVTRRTNGYAVTRHAAGKLTQDMLFFLLHMLPKNTNPKLGVMADRSGPAPDRLRGLGLAGNQTNTAPQPGDPA